MPVKKLLHHPGIVTDASGGGITYHHVLLGRHHVLDADGLPAESLLRAATPKGSVDALLARTAPCPDMVQTARPCAAGFEGALLL